MIPALSDGGEWDLGGPGDPCCSPWELGELQEGTGKDILDRSISIPRGPTWADTSQGTGLGVTQSTPRHSEVCSPSLLPPDQRSEAVYQFIY